MAIFGRLKEEGYHGGHDQVRRYVKQRRVTQRETFIPLSHDPGQRVEVDFPDGRRQVSVLMITWAYSNAAFALALPNEKIESILHGTVKASVFSTRFPMNYGGTIRKRWRLRLSQAASE